LVRTIAVGHSANSTVRHLLNLGFGGHHYPEYYVLADVEAETSLDTSESYLFSDRHHLAGFHSFSRTGARIFADVPSGPQSRPGHFSATQENLWPDLTLEQLQEHLDQRGPGTVTLKKLNWLSTFYVHRRLVNSYRHGRVFLAGDAAHVHSPASGQGMNMGLQDAFNLAWKLELVEKNRASPALLDTYSPERRRAGQATLRMTDFFSRINTLRNPVARWGRNVIGPWLCRQDWIRRRYRDAVGELSLNYRGSPIVREASSARPRLKAGPLPGERAPDGTLTAPDVGASAPSIRLFQLFQDSRHHLLLFTGGATAPEATALRQLAAWIAETYPHDIAPHCLAAPDSAKESADASILCDPGLVLHQKYGATAGAIYLIRPDGYVAFRGPPAAEKEFREYLKSIFN
jgi:hypothetical protein